jgi:hypothetical protein
VIAHGMGCIMHVTGESDGPPTSVGLPNCNLGTGIWALHGILAAPYESIMSRYSRQRAYLRPDLQLLMDVRRTRRCATVV